MEFRFKFIFLGKDIVRRASLISIDRGLEKKFINMGLSICNRKKFVQRKDYIIGNLGYYVKKLDLIL